MPSGRGGMEPETVSSFQDEESKTPHLLVLLIPFLGHFAAFVQLFHQLAARVQTKGDLKVTVLSSEGRITDLAKMKRNGDFGNLDLILREEFGTMPLYTKDPKFPVRAGVIIERNRIEWKPFIDKLIEQKGTAGAPTAIISDMFYHWAKDLADELNIPWYTYFPASVTTLLLVLMAPTMRKEGMHPEHSPNKDELVTTISGLHFMRICELPIQMFEFWEFFEKLSAQTKRATGILLNTSKELMEGAATTLRAQLDPSTRVLTIGPLLQHPGFGVLHSPPDSSRNCLGWLDAQPASSVLYIAFGTLGTVSNDLLLELAHGLESSGVSFLWALKLGSAKLSDVLPPGFEERTRGRGLIETAWAPQSRILLHPSTGGFLSHCGWNSMLESLVSGVPLIAWPIAVDQPMNARFVEKLGVGIPIYMGKAQHQDYSSEDVKREDVERVVRLLMSEGETRSNVKRNVFAVRKSLEATVAEGGSSYRNLHSFLDDVTGVHV